MDPERWRRIEALLSAALEREQGERASFLARECGGDAELQKQVEELLWAHRAASSFLETSPPEAAATLAAAGPIPQTEETHSYRDRDLSARGEQESLSRRVAVGRYVVLNRLGRGGMGVVYAAYDPELDRKVAVKLLRAEAAEELRAQEARARLLREAQAMARLSHPNVISVHDVGSFGEQIFIAMEFVEGRTLSRWLKEKERTTREVLEAFVQAGKGLAAAHAAGLVHRDFKPDNVLLGNDGRVKVLDFGLARAAEDLTAVASTLPMRLEADGRSTPRALEAPLTRSGAFFGTPAYMAPEQFLRKPTDARSDQFSFCVALYEALYGERPFAGETLEEIASAVLQGKVRPPPPQARVRPWLRSALLRGLAADPAQRHPDMNALLAALGRDRTRALRRWVSVGGVVSLAFAAGASIVTMREQSRQLCRGGAAKLAGVWDENRQRDVRTTFLATGLPYAQDAWQGAKAALDTYVAGWLGMYQDACEATHRRGEQSAALLDLRMLCLDRRRWELRALVDLFATADAKVVENAVQASRAQTPLSTCADVAALTARARRPEAPDTRKRVEELHSELAQIKALTNAGKYNNAIPLAEKAVEAARQIGDSSTLAEALLALEFSVRANKQPKRAQELLDEALQAALASNDQEALARAFVELGWVVGVDGARPEEGHRWSRYAQAALASLSGSHEDLEALRLRVVGALFQIQGSYAEAARWAQQGIALRERTLGPDHPEVAMALNNLGSAHFGMGAYAQAVGEFHKAAVILERSLGARHPLVASALANEAGARTDLGDPAGALPIHRRALVIRESVLAPDSPYLGESIGNIGAALAKLGRYDEGLKDLLRALGIFERSLGAKSPRFADVLAEIAQVHLSRGDFRSASAYARRSAAVFAEALGRNHSSVARALTLEGKAQLAAGAPERAIPPLERSLAICEGALVSPHLKADAAFTLGRALVAAGKDRRRALALARRARELYQQQGQGYESKLREVDVWLAQRPSVALKSH